MMRLLSVVFVSLAINSGVLAETNLALNIDGVTYEDVRFGQVRGNTVSIFYRGGVATVRIDRLPLNVQQELGYDPEKVKADMEKRVAAQAEQDAKMKAAGYVNVGGKWVTPDEDGKYLDRQATSRELGKAITAALVTRSSYRGDEIGRETISLLALIQNMSTHNYEILLENRRALERLKRYGHPAYAKAVNEFLGVCEKGVEIYRELQRADVDSIEAIGRHDATMTGVNSRPMSGQEAAGLMALGEKKMKGEAIVKRIESLRKEVGQLYQQGLDYRLAADFQK